MVQLIATPERFERRRVVVIGHLRIGFEECAIYLHSEDAEMMNTTNALWLSLGKDESLEKYRGLDQQPVSVRGRFRIGRQGHLGGFTRGLVDIESIEKQPTRADFARIRQSPGERGVGK